MRHNARMTKRSHYSGRLHLEKDGVPFLVAGRIDLLEAVDLKGSISQAAKAVGMSYKGAWDAIDAMNNQADEALVQRTPGGRRGGGTQLTEYGKRVVALVRAIEQEHQRALELLNERVGARAGGAQAFAEYRRLLQRFSLQTSARNHWVGSVRTVRADRVHAEIEIALDDKLSIVAHISTDSAKRLGIAPGSDIAALVKAVAVQIATPEQVPAMQANRLVGSISRLSQEGEQSELIVDLPGGRTVTAVMRGADGSGLRVGRKVVAYFDPRAVLLARLPGA